MDAPLFGNMPHFRWTRRVRSSSTPSSCRTSKGLTELLTSHHRAETVRGSRSYLRAYDIPRSTSAPSSCWTLLRPGNFVCACCPKVGWGSKTKVNGVGRNKLRILRCGGGPVQDRRPLCQPSRQPAAGGSAQSKRSSSRPRIARCCCICGFCFYEIRGVIT